RPRKTWYPASSSEPGARSFQQGLEVWLELEDAEGLPTDDRALLVPVRRHPRDEVAGPETCPLLLGDRFEHHRRRDDLPEREVTYDLELRVRRQRGDEAGLVERRQRVLRSFRRRAAALRDARDLRRQHGPGLQHQRGGDDAAEARRRRKGRIGVD